MTGRRGDRHDDDAAPLTDSEREIFDSLVAPLRARRVAHTARARLLRFSSHAKVSLSVALVFLVGIVAALRVSVPVAFLCFCALFAVCWAAGPSWVGALHRRVVGLFGPVSHRMSRRE